MRHSPSSARAELQRGGQPGRDRPGGGGGMLFREARSKPTAAVRLGEEQREKRTPQRAGSLMRAGSQDPGSQPQPKADDTRGPSILSLLTYLYL